VKDVTNLHNLHYQMKPEVNEQKADDQVDDDDDDVVEKLMVN
jgi:hypothetical protein